MDAKTKCGSSLAKAESSAVRSVADQVVLRDIEAALSTARVKADTAEDPVLAYLIDMAITELRTIVRPD